MAGLGFSSTDLSMPLSVSGVGLMVFSLFFFPAVERRLGARACTLIGLGVCVPLAIGMGATSFLAAAHLEHALILATVLVILILKTTAAQMCYPTGMVRPRILCCAHVFTSPL